MKVKRKVIGGPMDGDEVEVSEGALLLRYPVLGGGAIFYYLWKDGTFRWERE